MTTIYNILYISLYLEKAKKYYNLSLSSLPLSLPPLPPPPNIPHMRTSNKLPNQRLWLAALAERGYFLKCKSFQTEKLGVSRNERHVWWNLRRLWKPWTTVGFRKDFIFSAVRATNVWKVGRWLLVVEQDGSDNTVAGFGCWATPRR